LRRFTRAAICRAVLNDCKLAFRIWHRFLLGNGRVDHGELQKCIDAEPGLVGGIGTIAVALLWMKLFPVLRRVDRLE
jgi:hypothetical protein